MATSLKILIVEDQLITAQNLEIQLLEMGYSITDTVANSEDALLAFRRRIPDLVLMDIHLKGSELDGIEIAHQFNQIAKVPIIYISSLSDKATGHRANETRPASYLVKPWHLPQLERAIDLALFNFVHEKEADIQEALSDSSNTEHQLLRFKDFFFVKAKRNLQVKVSVDELLYIKGASESVVLFTTAGKHFHSSNLKSFSKKFSHPSLLRVHRSYIVNITKVNAMQDGFLLLGEVSIPIGPSYKSAVDEVLNRLKSD